MSSSPGSKWMSEEPRSTASLITRCTSWMTDASSPDAPKLIGASRRSYSGRGPDVRLVVVGLVGRDGAVAEVAALDAGDQRVDVARRGDGRAHLVAGHHRDVVDGEHVRGVGHGDQQRAVAGEGDR